MGKREYDGNSGRDERRELRRQRRIRSQIIAYIIAAIMVLTAVAGVGFAASKISVVIKNANIPSLEASTDASKVDSEIAAVSSPDQTVTESELTNSSEDILNGIVDTCLSEMPIEDKVAGLFMITPEQLTGVEAIIKAGTATQDALLSRAVGGVVYSSKNAKDSSQLTEMLTTTASMSKYPLFIATSEIGGGNSQIANALSLDLPASPSELAKSGKSEDAYNAASTVADYMNKFGFNLNLGINANLSDNEFSFGTDADVVSDMVSQTVSGLQSFGVSACLQYFPQMSDNGSSLEDMESALSPFRAGIEAGASMIMVCTAPSSGITGNDTPSCLSSAVIQDVLRNSLGYDGIIITDALADIEGVSSADSAVAALNAGADMLFCPGDFEEAYNGVLSAVQNGVLTEERINESLRRIFRVKYAERVADISE